MALAGKYINSFENPMGGGKQQGAFVFNIDGDTFTGTASADGMDDVPIQDGKINGDEITFVMNSSSPMGEMKINVKATLDGDSMTGTIDMGMGNPMAFEAKKA